MIRRKLTLKRVDPWSVLKFGFVVNLALLLVGLLGFWILWIVIGRLGLVEQFCDSVGTIVLDLQECSLNGGNIFRTLLLLGLLGVVVQTGILVFGAFLYNLISDLTGGLAFTFLDVSDDATPAAARRDGAAVRSSTTGTGTGADRPVDQSSTPARPTPDGPAATPRPRPFPDSETPAERPRPSQPSHSASESSRPQPSPSGNPRPSSSGSLWADPTRSNDRA